MRAEKDKCIKVRKYKLNLNRENDAFIRKDKIRSDQRKIIFGWLRKN